MIDPPKTLEEARKARYRRWAGNNTGTPYKEGYCVEEVPDGGRSVLFHQCGNRATVGLFCGRHDPEREEEGEGVKTGRTAAGKRGRQRRHAIARCGYRRALEEIVAIPNALFGGFEKAREVARKALAEEEG